jgi:hypothetical protein
MKHMVLRNTKKLRCLNSNIALSSMCCKDVHCYHFQCVTNIFDILVYLILLQQYPEFEPVKPLENNLHNFKVNCFPLNTIPLCHSQIDQNMTATPIIICFLWAIPLLLCHIPILWLILLGLSIFRAIKITLHTALAK